MKKSFISLISTDDYLPGLLVLFYSLASTNSKYSLLALVTPNVSPRTLSVLRRHKINYKILPKELTNPTDISKKHRWFSTYSKLYVFDQTQYEKIVYLDADMLVLQNIDELFDRPHMSAVNEGGVLPRKSHLKKFNSGLFVATPSHALFADMKEKVGKIEVLKSGGTSETPLLGSEQDFLNYYYFNWYKEAKLHLDHKYNIFHYHLDEYNKLFGYRLDNALSSLKIIHFASYLKPWHQNIIKKSEDNAINSLEKEACILWLERYRSINTVDGKS